MIGTRFDLCKEMCKQFESFAACVFSVVLVGTCIHTQGLSRPFLQGDIFSCKHVSQRVTYLQFLTVVHTGPYFVCEVP